MNGLLGALIGSITALMTKFTHIKDFPLLETSLFFLMSYSSYLLAEICEMSGIVSILFCGIFQVLVYLLKVRISRKNIVMLKLPPKTNEPICFSILKTSYILSRYVRLALPTGLATAICQNINISNLYNCSG